MAPLSITTTSPLPDAAVGTPYSQTFGASGGTPPYRWSGAAPGGLALSSDGLLSGTPATAGTFNFTVTVTDNASRTASSSFRITINPSALTITTNSPLPDGVAGTPYAQTLAASGGTPPYRWSGSAPAGLILSSDGSLTGTPPAAGSFNFTATVTDSASRTASRSFAIHINPAPLTITTNSPLPDATAGTPYSQTLAASGGTPPYRWSGSAPAGLILSSDGSLTGTPAAAGAFNFAATVTDSASRTVSRSFLININPASLTITTSSQLPDATAGIPYAQSLSASGGTPPYRWSGSVPAGFSLSSGGSLTGTPAAAGSLNFTATVTDNASRTATRSFAINVQPPPLAITTASPLPDAAVGSPYSQTFAAAGGTPPYNWSGSPPAGLTISTSGVIAGTPTGPGRFSFNVSVTDNSSAATTRTFSITINPPGLTISSSALSNGSVGVAYSQQISATGGVPPLSWSLAAGQMPVGLTLDGVNGVISGTPASSGVFIFTIQVRDNSGAAVLKQFSITVDEEQPAPASLTISTPAALPEGTAGAGYSQGLTAAGGAPPYVWSISGGSLPAGLTLIPESGLLNGTPSAPGSYSFTALVRDSRGATVSRQFSITIARSLSITTAVLPNPVFGADYQGAIT
ncbi:MAG TPA: putative Ig domain-containing protein, partial [Bryobacteraceae bacterium]|nr:putative Ig domain-containing protein [Bryobacteraceae bacterium]